MRAKYMQIVLCSLSLALGIIRLRVRSIFILFLYLQTFWPLRIYYTITNRVNKNVLSERGKIKEYFKFDQLDRK